MNRSVGPTLAVHLGPMAKSILVLVATLLVLAPSISEVRAQSEANESVEAKPGDTIQAAAGGKEDLVQVQSVPVVRFVRGTSDGYEALQTLPYYVPIYVEVEFREEPTESTRSVLVASEEVLGITVVLHKVQPLVFRSETPFFLELGSGTIVP